MNSGKKKEKRGIRAGAPQRRQAAPAGSRERAALPNCDPECGRFATCRPDIVGWVLKKQAAANLGSNPSALRQRARRIGYVSPAHKAMPRRDQPKLCFDGAYFVLLARVRRRGGGNGAGEQ